MAEARIDRLSVCYHNNRTYFFRFEYWSERFEKLSFAKRFKTYTQLLKRFTTKEQVTILSLSILRFTVYTVQYLILLKWMNIDMPFLSGFCMAALFFWMMAIIPSISLAELGIRGQVSIFLFQTFTNNKIGILVATICLWIINLILPAIVGSVLWIRMRLLK